MNGSSLRLESQAVELAWSLWAGLGIPAWVGHHESQAIDPEHLILFTAFLRDDDPRLRDEATTWCVHFGRYLSTVRFRNLLMTEAPTVRSAFGEFSATINAHSRLALPAATTPRAYRPTAGPSLSEFDQHSQVALRLRAAFGVNARAEILRILLAEAAGHGRSVADMATEAGFTKRNIADACVALEMGSVLLETRVRNQFRYRLRDSEAFKRFLGSVPDAFPPWRSVFHVVERLLETVRSAESLPAQVQQIEALKVVDELTGDLQIARVYPPQLKRPAFDAWSAFTDWAIHLVSDWAEGRSPRYLIA